MTSQVAALRDELATTHELLQAREQEVLRLMSEQPLAPTQMHADAREEVDELESMLVGAQQKVVKANQRAAALQTDLVKASFILRAFKMKVSFRLAAGLAAATKRRVVSEWLLQCVIGAMAKHKHYRAHGDATSPLAPVPPASSSSSSAERERERERERRVYGESHTRYTRAQMLTCVLCPVAWARACRRQDSRS